MTFVLNKCIVFLSTVTDNETITGAKKMEINSILFSGITFGVLTFVTLIGVIIENYGIDEGSRDEPF